MSERLTGRRVLVTGASSGIGAATAEAIVGNGGGVALLARSREPLDALVSQLGSSAVAVPGDVTDASAVALSIEQAAEALGGIDAVVCSAGIVRPVRFTDAVPDDWTAMFDVNVSGVLNTIHAALPHLRAADLADVVNISSMSGRRRASVEMGLYSASKFAVHVLSDSLREEFAPDGVRVTVVSPGYVNTPIFDGVADEDDRTHYQSQVRALGLDPEAVAAQVVHALSQPPGVNLVEIAMLSTNQ